MQVRSAHMLDLPEIVRAVMPAITAALDIFAILLSGCLTYYSYLSNAQHDVQIYIGFTVLYAILTTNLFHHAKLYATHIIGAWPTRMGRLFASATFGCTLLIVLAYYLKLSEQISRVWFLLFWLSSTLSIVATRGACKRIFDEFAIHPAQTIAVLGATDQAKRWLSQLNDRTIVNRILGVFDYRRSRIANSVSGHPVLGDCEYLTSLARLDKITEVVIALPWCAEQRIAEIVDALREVPVTVFLAPDLIGYRVATPIGWKQETMPLLKLASKPISGWSAIIKTAEDKVLAAMALLLVSPLMALICLAILLDSPGPILFRQKRCGFNNQLFDILKFRTMYDEQRDETASKLTVRNDPRVTRVGRFLRRYSLDELPQLFNVLNGTMSMIGPRPHAKAAKAAGRLYDEVAANYVLRHNVKPGITGWAQANGWRGETDNEEKIQKRVEYDLYYVANWSPWLDIRILFLSAIAVIRGENAW